MLKMKFFLVLLFSGIVWAIPFNVEVVKTGDGDEIRAGQLIKVHYKGYLYADIVKFDSLKVVADSIAKADSVAKAAAPKADAKKGSKKADKKVEEVKPDSAAVDSLAEEAPVDTLTPFADTYASGEPLEFTIGVGQVIAGWDKGIVGMKVLGEGSLAKEGRIDKSISWVLQNAAADVLDIGFLDIAEIDDIVRRIASVDKLQ